ncbi:MAG: type II CAAX prenyl endopeptidase Rce1 family protein [Candidatus Competibacterales bacterium]
MTLKLKLARWGRTRLDDLGRGLVTRPPRPTWWGMATVVAVYSAVALGVGLASGFLRPQDAGSVPGTLFWLLPLTAFLVPSLSEEAIFRGLLLPHPSRRVSAGDRWLAAGIGLASYVLWHPLYAALGPGHIPVWDPAFLILVAALGICCTGLYYYTGSLWPCVVLHWATVMVWIYGFGGRNLLLPGP